MPTGVSAIVPTRGDAPFLRAAVESVLAQPEVAELLLAHDRRAGEPPLPSALRSDPRVRVVESPRAGPAAARNAALAEARFAVVAFLDDDDAWLGGHLAAALDALARHPRAAVVAPDAAAFDDASGEAPLPDPVGLAAWRGPGAQGPVRYRDLLLANPILTSVAVVARDRLGSPPRFDEELATMEDYDLWLRLGRESEILLVPRVTGLVRRRRKSASRDLRSMAESGLAMLTRALDAAPEAERLAPSAARRRLGRLWLDLAYACLLEGDGPAARRAALEAWRRLPARPVCAVYLASSFAPRTASRIATRRREIASNE